MVRTRNEMENDSLWKITRELGPRDLTGFWNRFSLVSVSAPRDLAYEHEERPWGIGGGVCSDLDNTYYIVHIHYRDPYTHTPESTLKFYP